MVNDLSRLAARRLHWPDCINVRDLGGLPVAGDMCTRSRAIVRADSLQSLTGAGWRALVDYGVRAIIDLRAEQERERDGYAVPADAVTAGVTYRGVTMRPMDPALQAQLSALDLPEGYVLMIDTLGPQIAAVLRAIAAAPESGVVIHCSAGRDRTAIVSALLLALAGVPNDVIAADYVGSQGELWPRWEAAMAAALADPAVAGDPAALEAVRRQQPLLESETMLHLLRHIDTRYGGTAGYLAAIGLTAAERSTLLRRMVD